jgi:acetyl esterase/lipase
LTFISHATVAAALTLICAGALAAAPSEPVATTPLSVESFFQPSTTQSIQLSPSGRWMAIQGGETGSRVKLTVVDLEGTEPSRVIAMFTRFDVSAFKWVNEDWLVFSVRDQNDKSGKVFGGGLMSVRRDGEKMRQLIKRNFESLFAEHGNVALEPNNEMLAIGAPGTNDIIIGEDHYDTNYKEYVHTTLRTMDVSTGAIRSMFKDTPAPPRKITDWLIDGQGRPRVAVATQDKRSTIFWADPKSGNWSQIAEFSSLSADFSLAYVDEQDRLFVTATNSVTGLAELRMFDFTTGKPSTTALISLPGFDADASPIKDRGNNKVHGVRLLTDAQSVSWFTPAMAAIQAKVDAMLPGRVNMVHCHPCSAPKAVLIYSYSDTTPGEYLLYTPSDDKFARLAAKRPGHQEERMANVELHRSKTRDGADLPVWITKTASSVPRPAVVLVHGGPWMRGSEWQWDSEAQFLATRGYVVIEPEYRGSTGFGDAHFRAGWKQWGQRMQDDVADALKFAIGKGWVDGKRVCIAGASYGGYATLMGLAKDKDLYKCGVAWVAVTDPRYMFSVHWSDISESSKRYSMPSMIGDLEKDAAMLAANAPITLAAQIKQPLLLAYGAKDRRVPLVHGENMRSELIQAGSPPEWVVYDDEGHGWARTANKIDFWRRVETFLAKHLK